MGVWVTWLFSAGAVGLGLAYLRKLLTDADPALRVGLAGLVGLGGMGVVTLAVGLIPSGLRWGLYVVGLFALIGLGLLARERRVLSAKPPKGLAILLLAGAAIAMGLSLFGVLAPSDMQDWDSLAYHLAVPKLWLEKGQIEPVSFIHQSNFPFSVDNLYIWGLSWGGEAGAKAFSWTLTVFGLIAIFGFTRSRYGATPAWWATLAFATVPAVMWESGTGYIDVANGLYAGFGILFAASFLAGSRREDLWLGAICLGLAAGTKYTGLQTIAVVCFILFVVAAAGRKAAEGFRAALAVGLLALAIASPWYVKNELWKQNPVFPFFYGKLGGKDWDQRRADIYTHEQQTFGAGRAIATDAVPDNTKNPMELTRVGHSILGLAYQPGRYINPRQHMGGGDPKGAIGMAIVGALAACLIAGARRRFEGPVLAMIVLSLLLWFVLSQQSRYIIALAVPLAVLLGGAVVRLKTGPLLAAMAAVQALFSVWLIGTDLVSDQAKVVLGQTPADEYRAARIPFFVPSQSINKLGSDAKVALYDEVFGFLLDVPYVWANPGHSTEIPYDAMQSGADYARHMKQLGFTHVYLNLSLAVKDQQLRSQMLGAMGLTGPKTPFPPVRRKELMDNFEARFNVLVAEAVGDGLLVPVEAFPRPEQPRAILFALK